MQGLTAFSCAGTNHVLTDPSPPLRKLGAGQGAWVPEGARGMSLVLLCLLHCCEEAEICWMRAHIHLEVCFPQRTKHKKGIRCSAASPRGHSDAPAPDTNPWLRGHTAGCPQAQKLPEHPKNPRPSSRCSAEGAGWATRLLFCISCFQTSPQLNFICPLIKEVSSC